MSKIWLFALCVSFALFTGCASDGGKKVSRLDANSVTDLSGSWNDTDSRLVADEMINDCLGRPWYSQFAAQKGSVPTIVIGKVRNKSHEHIRVETFIKDIERALINSGKAEFVANSNEREDLRNELADQQGNTTEETTKDAGMGAYWGPDGDKTWAEAYDALGLSEADVQLAYDSNYFDPEVFSAETMRAITEARDTLFPHPSMGECVGLFLDKAIPGFFVNLHIYGFLLILALWLAAGEHNFRDWLCLGFEGALFCAAYLYLIWRGRYLVDRVDLGLLLCAAAVLALMLDAEKLRRERLLTVLVLLAAVGTSHYLMREWYRAAPAEDKSEIRAAYERLLADEDPVYLAKLDAVTDGLWSPFGPYGKGYWDKIVLLGGFDCLHPTIMENLAQYGVENPFRDCVGNPKVYLIEDNIDLTLQYIREHYDPKATAKRIEPLSTETGLDIYRILK